MYLNKLEGWKGQGPIKQRKGIVQKYTASVQQIGRTFSDKQGRERVEGSRDKGQ